MKDQKKEQSPKPISASVDSVDVPVAAPLAGAGASAAVVRIQRTHPDAQIPKFAHGPEEDAGMDLASVWDVVLRPNVPTLVPVGFRMALPPGIQAEIRSRSGMALKEGLTVFNSPGTIDPGYRGEVGVIVMWNGVSYNRMDGTAEFALERLLPAGTRIAQMVFMPYVAPQIQVVEDGSELAETARGEGGFGSTGVS